jgi:hypothetical protein
VLHCTTHQRFVKTTPNPRATKNKSGELEPLPGVFVVEAVGDEPAEVATALAEVELMMSDDWLSRYRYWYNFESTMS